MRGLWSLCCAAGCPYCALMTASPECQLADGRVVALRRADVGYVPAITGLYLGLSPESFYSRFNTGRPAPALVAQLASFGSGDACLVAVAPTRVPRSGIAQNLFPNLVTGCDG